MTTNLRTLRNLLSNLLSCTAAVVAVATVASLTPSAAPAADTEQAAAAQPRPNILWISCEDISPQLGCYGDPHAITPHLDQLAREGVRFENAFTPAGVCAVVRSGVITGMYPPAIGSQHMRSRIIPPAGVKCFPEYLRAAGYFCTNRSKTDYQFEVPESVWDRQGDKHTDWRERDNPEQPFFSVINFTTTHESQVRHEQAQHDQVIAQIGSQHAHDPQQVADTMPPYFPDTPAARQDWAWYLDNITRMDQQVGEVLRRLSDDGLADNTLVIFWSDHGMGLPRGKRWLYDSGTRVPVIARWPHHLQADSINDTLVSILDLTPTTLQAAGIKPPRHMHGRVLFGSSTGAEPPYLFFHRDRMDEVYELQRGSRDRRWKYIRNYEPEKPYSQHLEYMDQMPTMQDWRRLAAEGKLNEVQQRWFAAEKPIEELYDTEKDPWETHNLAEVPQYAERLARMREATEAWQVEIGDLGMIPEAVMMEEMLEGDEPPQVEAPRLAYIDDRLWMRCSTEDASIVYRLKSEAQWGPWKLYTKALTMSAEQQIEAKACRAGFRESPVVGEP